MVLRDECCVDEQHLSLGAPAAAAVSCMCDKDRRVAEVEYDGDNYRLWL